MCALAHPAWTQENDSDRYRYHDITAHLSTAQHDMLQSEREVLLFTFDPEAPALSPTVLTQSVEHLWSASAPHLLVEGLFLIPLSVSEQEKAQALTLYNISRAISTLTGIQYYSASRKEYRTFYTHSYAIDNPEQEQQLPDPLVNKIPAADTQYINQRDLSFGENIYRANYTHAESITTLTLTNVHPVYYSIFRLTKAEGLRTFFAIIPTDAGILFYGASFINADAFFGLKNKVVRSFSNRLTAISTWYTAQLVSMLAQ